MARIRIAETTLASVPTPPAGKATIFLDSADDTFKAKFPNDSIVLLGVTEETVQDIVGQFFQDSSTIDVTYNDAGDVLSVSVIENGLDSSLIPITPSGNLTSTNIQDAFNELQADADGKLPKDGTEAMTGSLDLGDNDLQNAANIDLKNNATKPSHLEGRTFYDKDEHSLAVYNDEADMTQQIGQEHIVRVFNNSGATITDASPVYISGTEVSENRPTIALAKADSPTTAKVIGLTTHSIENNTFGYVTRLGLVNDVDTSSFSEGDVIYLSEDVAGEFKSTPPSQGNSEVLLGYVINSNASEGRLLVDISAASSVAAGDSKSVIVAAKKGTVGTINPGEVVYITGFSGTLLVEKANATNDTKMPGFAIARTTITNTSAGDLTLFGELGGLNTSSFSVGDSLYVSTTDGQLTNVKPIGPSLIQKIATVVAVDPSEGIIEVFGAGRSNDLPNLAQDKFWRGDVNGVPQEVDFDAEVAATPSVTANTAKVSADGPVTTHSDVTSAGSGAIITNAERSKLSGIEAGATADQVASEVPVTPVGNLTSTQTQAALEELQSDIDGLSAGAVTNHSGLTLDDGTNPHGTTKADVLLGNVDNTSDANKPVSTAQQNALDLKAPINNPTFTGTVSGITKGMVGLGNVDNTADTNKAIAGDVTGTLGASTLANNTVSTAKIQNNAVDNTKLADMPSQTVKGRLTAGTGDPENLTVAQIKQLLGTTGNGDFARTTNTASFSVPTTYTAHPMNSTALKTAATIIDHNPATNNSRITAVIGGKFVCSYHIVIESGTNTDRTIDSYLRINGAGIVAGSRTECYTTNAGSIQNMSVAIPILLNAGDYIEVMIRASNTLQTSVANYNSFSLEKVG